MKPEKKERRFRPYVAESVQMKEFTLRAVLLGLALTVVLGAANAYLGLRAGAAGRKRRSRKIGDHGDPFARIARATNHTQRRAIISRRCQSARVAMREHSCAIGN